MQNQKMNDLFAQKPHAFVGYLVAGYPTWEESLRLARECCAQGIDILEIGFPAADPSCDGEVIRKAQEQIDHSIANDLRYWRELREAVDAPIWVMGYRADLLEMGLKLAQEHLYDALVIPDMSSAERIEWKKKLAPLGVDMVGFTTPLSTESELADCFGHMELIYQQLYCGPTGVANNSRDYVPLLERTRAATKARVFAGFGISTPERSTELIQSGFDGVVIGSAILKKLGESPEKAYAFINTMQQTVRG